MSSGILISVNLPGALGPRVKHTTKQTCSMVISQTGKKKEIITRKILHTDRPVTECTRKFQISPEILNSWCNGDCPSWVKLGDWKKMNRTQKIDSYVKTFDQGYGVSYE